MVSIASNRELRIAQERQKPLRSLANLFPCRISQNGPLRGVKLSSRGLCPLQHTRQMQILHPKLARPNAEMRQGPNIWRSINTAFSSQSPDCKRWWESLGLPMLHRRNDQAFVNESSPPCPRSVQLHIKRGRSAHEKREGAQAQESCPRISIVGGYLYASRHQE